MLGTTDYTKCEAMTCDFNWISANFSSKNFVFARGTGINICSYSYA